MAWTIHPLTFIITFCVSHLEGRKTAKTLTLTKMIKRAMLEIRQNMKQRIRFLGNKEMS